MPANGNDTAFLVPSNGSPVHALEIVADIIQTENGGRVTADLSDISQLLPMIVVSGKLLLTGENGFSADGVNILI